MSIVKNINALRTKSMDVASVEEAMSIIKQIDKEFVKVKKFGVGLAAIQVGIPKRVGVINYKNKTIYLINPEVVDKKREFVFGQEGCLSFPNQYINTKRYTDFTIDNHVMDGDKLRKERQYFYYDINDEHSDGLLAIAVQHEMDHFDGKVFTDIEAEKTESTIRREVKTGRNDPCPCGSGKKFKKCCLGT